MHGNTPGDRGAGSLMVVGVALAVTLVAWLVFLVATLAAAHHRAESAADLAALAGARAALAADPAHDVTEPACAAAADTAAANGARLDACSVIAFADFAAVAVDVSVDAPVRVPGLPDRLEATSRAGNPGET
ncbi:MAG: hypothetical protein LBR33_09150 [Propionibacteriaceae bacterium]|nr:hypothetical protein [Propionibacteriaceae bacterium]